MGFSSPGTDRWSASLSIRRNCRWPGTTTTENSMCWGSGPSCRRASQNSGS
nr:MAG TPA: hypothetical protein [Caudoviricetes sp.]